MKNLSDEQIEVLSEFADRLIESRKPYEYTVFDKLVLYSTSIFIACCITYLILNK